MASIPSPVKKEDIIQQKEKKIFIICPIGKEDSEIRKRSDQIKKFIIDPVAHEFSYTTKRADHIFQSGIITDQIIVHLENDDIVIADLTGPNANVFYELAIRQVCGLPVILMCSSDQRAPFDVQSQRIIFVNHTDLEQVDSAKKTLYASIKAIEEGNFEYASPIKISKFADINEKNVLIEQLEKIVEDTKKKTMSLETENINLENNIQKLRSEVREVSVNKGNLEGKIIKIGYISSTTTGLETDLPYIKTIIEPDINKHLNRLGYNVKFEVEIDDARGQAEIHLEKVQNFHSSGTDLILGGQWSSMAQASLQYCNEKNILLLSSASTSPILSIENDNLFRMCPTDIEQAPIVAEMVNSKGIEAVLVLHRGDSWGDALYELFESEYDWRGGTIIDRIRYRSEATEFSSYLQKAEDIMKDAVSEYGFEYCAVQTFSFDEIITIAKQAEDYPTLFNLIWFGVETTGKRLRMIDDAPLQASLLKFYSPAFVLPESEKHYDLARRYFALTGVPLSFYSACFYDAAWAIVKSVLETQSTDAKDVINVLPKICEDMWGVSGWCSLNNYGDRQYANCKIYGYGSLEDDSVQSLTYGLYDSTTKIMHWYKDPILSN